MTDIEDKIEITKLCTTIERALGAALTNGHSIESLGDVLCDATLFLRHQAYLGSRGGVGGNLEDVFCTHMRRRMARVLEDR